MHRALGGNADTLGTTEVDYVVTCVEGEQFMLRSILLKTAHWDPTKCFHCYCLYLCNNKDPDTQTDKEKYPWDPVAELSLNEYSYSYCKNLYKMVLSIQVY